jgi:hypothetical protein
MSIKTSASMGLLVDRGKTTLLSRTNGMMEVCSMADRVKLTSDDYEIIDGKVHLKDGVSSLLITEESHDLVEPALPNAFVTWR